MAATFQSILHDLRIQKEDKNTIIIDDSKLLELFQYSENAQPLVSVHRGGKGLKYYPENCLETLQYVNDSILAIFEIDVAKTKDGVLVLMHDNTLERTTTGQGVLEKQTFNALQDYFLKDDFGDAVSNFCKSEKKQIENYIEACRSYTPFNKDYKI